MTKKIFPLNCVQVEEEETSDINHSDNDSEKCNIKKCCHTLWCGKYQIPAIIFSLFLLLLVVGSLSLWVRVA